MENPINFFTYKTVHGPLTLAADKRGLCHIAFGICNIAGEYKPSATTNAAASQLQEYLAGKRRSFELDISYTGSPFQQEVWQELMRIDYGQACSTAELAQKLGKPHAYRSLGSAIKENKLCPIIPSHRIIVPNDISKRAKLYEAFRKLEAHACKLGI